MTDWSVHGLCLVRISITGPSVIPPSAHPTDLPGAERELEFDYHLSIEIWSQSPLSRNFDQPLGKNNISPPYELYKL